MSRHPSASPSTPLAVALDAILIVVFAAIGRESHGQEWTGAMETATPFLLGGVVGWLIWWAVRRSAPTGLVAGVVVWLSTVVVGMIVRQLTDQGTATAFVIVSLVVTGVLLLGWRAIALLLARRSRSRS